MKGLDQDSRASLRKHGVRFGQYTLFQPLLLKPAPTRLRLVLWSLKQDFPIFPEAPPPGLVTVPAVPDALPGYYPRAGYRLAGERAIRIDMLERLADMVRTLDARAGFEATPEMLSITGLSLDQFAKLMQGLGFRATSDTRPKRRPAAPAAPAVGETAAGDPEPDAPQPEIPVPSDPDIEPPEPADVPPPVEPDVPIPDSPDVPFPQPTEIPIRDPEAAVPEAAEAEAEAGVASDEMETFYVFVRGQRPRPEARPERRREAKPPKRKPQPPAEGEAKGPRPGRDPRRGEKQPPPPRPEKPIDPDNPFAALMALKLGR